MGCCGLQTIMSRIGKARTALQNVTHLGLRWAAYRTIHAGKQNWGWYERVMPVALWEAKPLSAFIKHSALAVSRNYLDYRKVCPAVFFFKSADRHLFARLLRSEERRVGK